MAADKVNRRSFLAASGLIGDQRVPGRLQPASGGGSAAPSAAASAAAAAQPRPRRPPRRSARRREGALRLQLERLHLADQHRRVQGGVTGSTTSSTTSSPTTRSCIAKLQGGASGYDIAARRPSTSRAWSRKASSRSSTCRGSRTPATSTRPSRTCGGIPNNEYHVPKDYGTTGILYRKTCVSAVPTVWQEFYDLIKGEASGKTVFVDSMGDVFVVPAQDAGLLAQLGRPGRARGGARDPARGRAARPGPRLRHLRRQDGQRRGRR